jgi:outer membrane protein TolC
MLKKQTRGWLLCGPSVLLLLTGGCVLSPKGAKSESDRVARAGAIYEQLPQERPLPLLPAHPDLKDVVDRAMLADGQLEAAYFQWAAAMQRVTVAGTYPNTNLSLGLSYMLKGGGSAWNRTTVQLSPDGMDNLQCPSEVSAAAHIALAEAQAAGAQYGAMRRQVTQRITNAWLDYTLQAEEIRLQRQDVSLLKLNERSAQASMSAGGAQEAMLDAQVASARGRERLHELESLLTSQRAALNAMMRRPVEAELNPPQNLPPPEAMTLGDEQLLALAARNDPQLAALAQDRKGRAGAIKLAKLDYLPDINPHVALTGNISQVVGAGLSMPFDRLPAIKAMVRQTHDQWRASAALYEQAKFDRASELIAALVMMRHNQHKAMLFTQQVLPVVQQAVKSLGDNYAAGNVSLAQLIDAQRTLLSVERTIAEARIGREKYLADVMAVVGQLPEKNKPTEGKR